MEKSTEQIFSEKVALRYHLYKSLMSELPFANIGTYHVWLALFSDIIWKQYQAAWEGGALAVEGDKRTGGAAKVAHAASKLAVADKVADKFILSKYFLSAASKLDIEDEKKLAASAAGKAGTGDMARRLGAGLAAKVTAPSAKVIIDKFFKAYLKSLTNTEQIDILFKFIQFIERQVTLFDALEEASFEDLVDTHGKGTLKNLLTQVEAEGKWEMLAQLLATYRIRIVLTAHPTQFYPAAVLMIIHELYLAIRKNDLLAIQGLLMQLGRTPFRNKRRPRPEHEAESILVYLKNVFYRVIPAIEEELEQRLQRVLGEAYALPLVIEMGFWPGGDRDGNPYVVATTTKHIANMLRLNLLDCYIADIKALQKSLTFKNVHEALLIVHQRLMTTYQAMTSERALPLAKGGAVVSKQKTRYASLYAPMHANAQANELLSELAQQPYRDAEEFLQNLQEIEQEIITQHNGLFTEKVSAIIRKVKIFGFHFATIDIRQNSSVHRKCTLELLRKVIDPETPYESLRAAARVKYLLRARKELRVKRSSNENLLALAAILAEDDRVAAPLGEVGTSGELAENAGEEVNFSEILQRLARSLRSIPYIQARNGKKGLHRYIISNTEAATDVLELFFLFAAVGIDEEAMEWDIVPLFETIDVLKRAHLIMKQLYQVPLYREHLKRRRQQVVMLGYSDGTKDGGYLAANWSIFRARELISTISRQMGIKVIFFDGRGGPPARGGGESNLFYRALSDKMATHEIQLTVQGQTISSNFATLPRGRYNVEQILTAGLENKLFLRREATLSAANRRLLEKMSHIALDKYENFKNHKQFIPYLEQVSPLRFMSHSNVGSRPSKRSDKEGINLTNLRAIPFVASWNQLKQNVPAYYGFGTALEHVAKKEKQLKQLQKLYQKSIFFRALIGNTMQALLKTDFSLTAHIRNDENFEKIWKTAYKEARLTEYWILKITGYHTLLEDLPLNRLSISLREHIVRPLLVIQQYALIRLKEEKNLPAALRERLEKMVVRSLAGSINASRNSA